MPEWLIPLLGALGASGVIGAVMAGVQMWQRRRLPPLEAAAVAETTMLTTAQTAVQLEQAEASKLDRLEKAWARADEMEARHVACMARNDDLAADLDVAQMELVRDARRYREQLRKAYRYVLELRARIHPTPDWPEGMKADADKYTTD